MKVRLSKGSKYLGRRSASLGGLGLSVGLSIGAAKLSGEKLDFKTLAKSTASGIFFGLASPWITWGMLGLDLAAGAIGGMNNMVKESEVKNKARNDTGMRVSYQDTQQAATMRQAAIQAIQGSKLNARNALGGEAAMMHRRWSR